MIGGPAFSSTLYLFWFDSSSALHVFFSLTNFIFAGAVSDFTVIPPSFSICDRYELMSSTARLGGHTDKWLLTRAQCTPRAQSRHRSACTQQQNNHREHAYVKRATIPSVLVFSLGKLSVWWLMCSSTKKQHKAETQTLSNSLPKI